MAKRLDSERPVPSDELVRRISARLSARQRRRSWSLGLAFVFTMAVVAAFALTGGIRYSALAASAGSRAVTDLVFPTKATLLWDRSTKPGDKGGNGGKGGGGNDGHGSGDDQYGHKVLLCHDPKGRHPQTISVDQSGVQQHLRIGDTLGACKGR